MAEKRCHTAGIRLDSRLPAVSVLGKLVLLLCSEQQTRYCSVVSTKRVTAPW